MCVGGRGRVGGGIGRVCAAVGIGLRFLRQCVHILSFVSLFSLFLFPHTLSLFFRPVLLLLRALRIFPNVLALTVREFRSLFGTLFCVCPGKIMRRGQLHLAVELFDRCAAPPFLSSSQGGRKGNLVLTVHSLDPLSCRSFSQERGRPTARKAWFIESR